MKTITVNSKVYGTNAERLAMNLSAGDNEIKFYETDTNAEYEWKGSEWIQINVNGAVLVTDTFDLSGNAREDISMSTTGAQSAAALTGGIYAVMSDVDCYIRVAATASDVTVAAAGGKGGLKLLAGNMILLTVPDQYKIGAIVAAGTGTLQTHRVK